jgi:hypothetical protein
MVRANDQGSHCLFGHKGLWRRGVCLELDYRRTITMSHGGETQEAQEGDLSLAHLLVVAALAFTRRFERLLVTSIFVKVASARLS